MNGYVFESKSADSIEKMMKKIISKTPKELIEMSNKSALKAAEITPQKWVESLMTLLK